MKKFKIYNVQFTILLGIAIVLGVAIYNQQQVKAPSPTISPSPSPQLRPLPENLTAEERFILNPPPAEASRSVLQKHAQTVKKLAKEGDAVAIKDCHADPLVVRVKQGSEIQIKNMDNVSRTIIFDEDHIFKLPPESSKTIKAKFKYGTGDYGYVCHNIAMVGFLHVVP